MTSASDDARDTPEHPSQTSPTRKRRRKDKGAPQPHILQQFTFRRAAWSYFHLSLITPETAALPPSATSPNDISLLTVLPILTAPLQGYLGATGAAIPFDILKASGKDVWIRVQRLDARAFRAALSGWVGETAREHVPGVELMVSGGKVKVAWMVKREAETVLGMKGDGGEMFEG